MHVCLLCLIHFRSFDVSDVVSSSFCSHLLISHPVRSGRCDCIMRRCYHHFDGILYYTVACVLLQSPGLSIALLLFGLLYIGGWICSTLVFLRNLCIMRSMFLLSSARLHLPIAFSRSRLFSCSVGPLSYLWQSGGVLHATGN